MKKTLMAALVLCCALFLCAGAALAQDDPQEVSEFGDEICGIMQTNPAGLMSVMPLRYVTRVALGYYAGGEDELYDMVNQSGMSIDELIDASLEDSGMLEDGAGAEYFGEDAVDTCYWTDPEYVDCEDMIAVLSEHGLMVGTIPAGYDSLYNAGVEQGLQSCSAIRVVTDIEDMTMALLMFDNYWYMVTAFDNNE